MPDERDMDLLRDYGQTGSEAAFATVVRRHVNLVYSVASRQVNNAAQAEEIAQAVFVILARKGPGLRRDTILEGWLHETTRLTALSFLRGERRRQFREQEAYMQSTLHGSDPDPIWEQLAPMLDEALSQLGKTDRDAVMLRFFKEQSVREVAAALQMNEGAAQRRVLRAVEKLRRFFARRGVVVPAAVLTTAISAHSVHAAPAALAASATALAASQGATASSSTLTLIKGALKIMAWTKVKTAAVVGVGLLLTAGATTVVVEKIIHPTLSTTDLSWANDPKYWELDFNDTPASTARIKSLPPVFILRPTRFPQGFGSIGTDGRIVAKNQPVAQLFGFAYDETFRQRAPKPAGLPTGHFDLMLTLPDEQHPREKLQAELKKRFGLVAHWETNDTDALIVKQTRPDAPGLVPTKGEKSSWTTPKPGPQHVLIKNFSVEGLRGIFATYIGKPVFDETGLTDSYDCDLIVEPRPGESKADAFKRAVTEQLGFSFEPARKPIASLVVGPATE